MTIPWRLIVGGAVSAKFLVFGVGYVTWFVAAKTGEGRRKAFLDHVSDVFFRLDRDGVPLEGDARQTMLEDIDTLRAGVACGWRTSTEFGALARILGFTSRIHSMSIIEVFTDLAKGGVRMFGNFFDPHPLDERHYFS